MVTFDTSGSEDLN